MLLDGTYEVAEGEDGKEEFTYVPVPDEKMKKYRDIVMKAVGYDEVRGDQIEVSNIPFETERLTEEEKKAMSREGLFRKIWKVVPYLVTLALIALLILFVLRPLVKWLTVPGSGATARIAGRAPLAELEGEVPPVLMREGASGREQVTQLARADAKQFAGLLKNWISKE